MEWDLDDEVEEVKEKKVKKKKKTKSKSNDVIFSDDVIKGILYPEHKEENKSNFCLMFYGSDGTGKTGLLQSYPLEKDEKHIILDLDGGNIPILETYNEDMKDNIIVVNPLSTKVTEDNRMVIDFEQTMNKIKFIVDYVRRKYKKDKIKALSIDGLSKLLKYAENQMRIDKHISADGGVEYRYWKVRNEMFMEIIELIKSLPVDKFFIAHNDFVPMEDDENELSAVKQETNRVMYQKVRCKRRDLKDRVEYYGIIDKSKYNVQAEGQKFVFLTIDKENKKFNWKGEKVYTLLKK